MAPDLVDSYSKNLKVKPVSISETEIDRFYLYHQQVIY